MQWSDIANKQLKKFPKDTQNRIKKKAFEVKQDPYSYDIRRLKNQPESKFRVGDIRVILKIINEGHILHIVKVAKRSRVYD